MNKKVIFGFSFLIIISLGVTLFMFINANKKPNSKQAKEVELRPVDETWNLYTNRRLGFSVKIPKEVNSWFGACEWDDKKDSYVSKQSIVPLKIIEANDAVYIMTNYYYDLLEQQGDGYKFLDCKKKDSSIDNSGERWQIIIKNASNDKEIDDFIKSQMEKIGSGSCFSMGNKILTKQKDVYDVEIKGDDKDLEESSCGVNFDYVLKYYPAKNKIAYWFLGQEPTFYKENGSDAYDGEMIDSFEFIE